MGNPKAFLSIDRQEGGYRPKEERVKDYNEFEKRLNSVERRAQASRCMECGVPFCAFSVPFILSLYYILYLAYWISDHVVISPV